MTSVNRQWHMAGRPVGRAVAPEDFAYVEAERQEPEEGEVVVKVRYLGFDPAQKGWMENSTDYLSPTATGEVMRARGIGRVVASRSPAVTAGQLVCGFLGWQEYATLPAAALEIIPDDDSSTAYLGVLGTTGMTAYVGLKRIGRPFVGDTMVVTGAAGATGSIVGQLGKLGGCEVIGVAGGADKCAWLTDELGFDHAVDYKSEDVAARMRELAPAGIDVIWDNVGGQILDDLLGQIAQGARVVLCGGITRYEAASLPPGPSNYFNLVLRRAEMQGFIALDHAAEFPRAKALLRSLVLSGRIKYREDVQRGFENAPATFARLFDGSNMGKQLLDLD